VNASNASLRRFGLFLRPGLGLKRWLLVMGVGMVLAALGLAFATAQPISPNVLGVLRTLTLAELSPLARGALFFILGGGFMALGAMRVYRLVVLGASQGRGQISVLATLDRYRRQGRGPRIVAIGGGTGLSTTLRGLKQVTHDLTAIVTVADDGGSSGRLRAELGIPPPGDARNCVVALSEAEPLMEDLFSYRFRSSSSLDGHSVGNLLLAALSDLRGGFQEALEAAGEILVLSGRVVPVSDEVNLVLKGETVTGRRLEGESAVGRAVERLRRVAIFPEDATINEAAVEAIAFADLIVIGPGSLYTSVIPNLLVRGMREALDASPAVKVFVCNVATQPHETDGYGVVHHWQAFREHSGVAVTHLLVNSNVVPLPVDWGQAAIAAPDVVDGFPGRVVAADVVDEARRTRHDPTKLANALMEVLRDSR